MSKNGIKVYLSGPMSGKPDGNVREFAYYARQLRLKGFLVHNPAETEINVAQPWEHCLKNDLKHMFDCDGIAIMPGWENSRGARLELYVAITVGMPVYDAVDGGQISFVVAEPLIHATLDAILDESMSMESPETTVEHIRHLMEEQEAERLRELADSFLNSEAGKQMVVNKALQHFDQTNTPEELVFDKPDDEEEYCIDEAKRIVAGPRRRDYDHPLDNHRRIANLWNDFLELPEAHRITPEQVAWMMILLKIAREIHTHKRDNVTDVIGYAHCVDEMMRESIRRGKVESKN